METRLFRVTNCYLLLKRYDDAVADFEFVLKHSKKASNKPYLLSMIIMATNEKYGIGKFFVFSPQPAPLPKVDAQVCNAVLEHYKQHGRTAGNTDQHEMEILLWRAIRGEYDEALRGIAEKLTKQYSDQCCYTLSQLHINLRKFEEAIHDFEEMFANDETELEDHEISCVLHQIAFCAIELRKRDVALKSLEEAAQIDPKTRDTEYWKQLHAQATKIKRGGT